MSRRTAVLVVPLIVLALAGCVDAPGTIGETPTASSTGTPTATPTPTPTATATTAPVATSEPFAISCSQLISADEIYDYNPNFGPIDDWTASPGTPVGDGVAAQGTACRWQNQSSGATVDISVAHLLEPALSAKRDEVAASSAPANWAIAGYFSPGLAQAFTDKYWITLQSDTFSAPDDVIQLVDYLVAPLG